MELSNRQIIKDGVTYTYCSNCESYKISSEFGKRSNSTDGLKSRCKVCSKIDREKDSTRIKERRDKYFSENRDALNEKKREKYTQNSEEKKSRSQKYRMDNPEYEKNYRKNNKEKIKKYRVDNKEKIRDQRKDHYDNIKEGLSIERKEKYYTIKKSDAKKLRQMWDIFVNNGYIDDEINYFNGISTYLIICDDFCKIGITKNITLRIEQISSHVRILEVYILPYDIETILHSEYSEYRFTDVNKKWHGYTELFKLSEEQILNLIKNENFKKYKQS